MLSISDVNSAGRPPPLSTIIKPPDPFLCLLSPLNRISKAPSFLKKKGGGAKRLFEVAKAYAKVRKKVR